MVCSLGTSQPQSTPPLLEETYISAFTAAPTGLFLLDARGRILDANTRAAAIFGFTPDELRGCQLETLLPPRYQARYRRQNLLPRLCEGHLPRLERVLVGRHREGFEIPIGVSLSACQTRERPLITGVIADIRQRRRLMARHWQMAKRFKQLLDSSATVIYTVDLKLNKETYVSENVARVLGYPLQTLRSQEKFWYNHLHPDDRKRVLAEYREQIRAGEGSLEYRLRHADGGYRWIYDSFRIIRYEHGRPSKLLGSWTDITERKTAEIERDRIETELRLAQKLEAVGQLASGIAHEINTPIQFVGDSVYFLQTAFEDLQTLLGHYRNALNELTAQGGHDRLTARLQEAEEEADLAYLTEEVPQTFERIFDGIGRVTAIVRAMKEFGHTDQREKTATDLNKALQNTLTVARNEYKYVAEVVTEFGDIPLVECLASDLNQVFLNLIVNAAHAIADVVGDSGARGRITLRTRREGETVVIEIEDTGSGIPAEIADRIFDPFFTTKEVGKGTGQGLAIARNIVVDKHGGTLTFDSQPGRGTCFFIRLPIHAKQES